MEWVKCSERLPEYDHRYWIVDKERIIDCGWFERKIRRLVWNAEKLQFVETIEPGWRLDEEYNNYSFLDTITHWMPYFTPELP